MKFFGEKMKKIKKNLCGAVPRNPQRDPQNLCLQGKWMPLTLHLATDVGISSLTLLKGIWSKAQFVSEKNSKQHDHPSLDTSTPPG